MESRIDRDENIANVLVAVLMVVAIAAVCVVGWYLYGQRSQRTATVEKTLVELQHATTHRAVRCQFENGELNTYELFIPPEVARRGTKAVDNFAKGYCSSLGRSYLP